MKNYFDLEKEDIKKYKMEFVKTPGGKRLYTLEKIFLILVLVIIAVYFIVTGTQEVSNLVTRQLDVMVIGLLIITLVYDAYFNFNFCSWLKNKHNIKRWQLFKCKKYAIMWVVKETS